MPLIVDSFNKNVYINDDIVGYIGRNVIYIDGHKFADLTDDGVIVINNKEVGYVDDDNSIIVEDKEVGYVDEDGNFVFYKPNLK